MRQEKIKTIVKGITDGETKALALMVDAMLQFGYCQDDCNANDKAVKNFYEGLEKLIIETIKRPPKISPKLKETLKKAKEKELRASKRYKLERKKTARKIFILKIFLIIFGAAAILSIIGSMVRDLF